MPELATAAHAPYPAPAHRGAEVLGLGIAVPEEAVPNAPIAARLGIDEDWIVQRTGIRERHRLPAGERLAGLAAEAGARALEAAAVPAAELDLILLATITNDELTPAASARVAAALGARRAGAIDLGAACTGFVSGLALACAQVEAGRAERVLVIGADAMTRVLDPDDRSTAALFGDGAGAVVVRAGAGASRVGPVVLRADGGNADLIRIGREEGLLRMDGPETFRHAVDRIAESTEAAAAAAGVGLADIDLFAFHQANARILRAVGERLHLPAEKIVDCIEGYGNVSAASIPLALDHAQRSGALVAGARVLLAAIGAGLTWGATVIEWGGGDA